MLICRLLMAVITVTCFTVVTGGQLNAQQAKAPATENEWNHIYRQINDKYLIADRRAEAVTDMKKAILDRGNNYSKRVMDGLLAIQIEYFGMVDRAALHQFRQIIYGMIMNADQSRINHIAEYFRDQPHLYNAADEAIREYFSPVKAEIELSRASIEVNDTVGYKILAWNKDGIRLFNPGLDVRIEDPLTLEIAGETTLRGLQPGKVRIYVEDNQLQKLAKADLEITRGDLWIEPENAVMNVGEKKRFTVKSSTVLRDSVTFALVPEDAASLLIAPPSPGSSDQHLELTAKKPYLDFVKLWTYVSYDSTFASIMIRPTEPVPPDLKLPVASSIGTMGLLLLKTLPLQSDADELRDAEIEASQTPGKTQQEIDKIHKDYVDKQNSANVFWIVSGATTVVTGYLWYKYIKKKKKYHKQMAENEAFGNLGIGIDPEGGVQLVYSF